MANYVKNDLGKEVLAIGAPGSIARVQVQYPALIARIHPMLPNEAFEAILAAGIASKLETQSLLLASGHEFGLREARKTEIFS